MRPAAGQFFRGLIKELEILIEGAALLDGRPEVEAKLKHLRLAAVDLENFVKGSKITEFDARDAFMHELKEFIAFLNGRLDE